MTRIESKMKELKELKAMIDNISSLAKEVENEIKTYMDENELDEIINDIGKITYREVISKRFDSTSFKKSEWSELYEMYSKTTINKRFTFSN